jgi:N-acetylneuraminate synthase
MIKIGSVEIGFDKPPYYIADIAANHNGDLQHAYDLIEQAKKAGAHAAKFQNFKAAKIVSDAGFRSVGQVSHQASWKKSVFSIYDEYSLPDDWSPLLKKHCDDVGIEYMTSPYDFESVDWADQFVNAYKIGSGDITWLEILKHIATKGKPVILSTGASTLEDVHRAVILFEQKQLVLLQCNTNYTASRQNLQSINLNVLATYAREFPDIILGLSDHVHGHATVLGAIALGARVIEKHFTDDTNQIGPDHKFSMTPSSFSEMVKYGDDVFYALGDGVKRIEDNEQETKIIQRRGLYLTKNKEAGKIICKEDLEALRPALTDGFAPYEIGFILGKTLNCQKKSGEILMRKDIN